MDDIRRHHEHKAARGVSLKTIKLGGIRNVINAGNLCDQLGMSVNVSCKTGESSLAGAAGLHIAAALPQINWGLTLSHQGLSDDITAHPLLPISHVARSGDRLMSVLVIDRVLPPLDAEVVAQTEAA